MRKAFSLLFAAGLTACAYPNSTIEQGAENGLFTFPAAPGDAHVILDGQDAGPVGAFQGANALAVKPGTHRVILSRGGDTLLDKKYYVGAGAKVVVQND
jgi:hypothetical protein